MVISLNIFSLKTVQYVEPGQKLQLDGTNLTYDDLIKHGNGEMIVDENLCEGQSEGQISRQQKRGL